MNEVSEKASSAAKPFCRRCLLEETDENELFSTIKEYVAALPEEKRADGATYEKRLKLCGECESLVRGMCAECGCYVELRAAKKLMSCAAAVKKW